MHPMSMSSMSRSPRPRHGHHHLSRGVSSAVIAKRALALWLKWRAVVVPLVGRRGWRSTEVRGLAKKRLRGGLQGAEVAHVHRAL